MNCKSPASRKTRGLWAYARASCLGIGYGRPPFSPYFAPEPILRHLFETDIKGDVCLSVAYSKELEIELNNACELSTEIVGLALWFPTINFWDYRARLP